MRQLNKAITVNQIAILSLYMADYYVTVAKRLRVIKKKLISIKSSLTSLVYYIAKIAGNENMMGARFKHTKCYNIKIF